jgi:penicillin amidase
MKIFKIALLGLVSVLLSVSLYAYFFMRNSLAPLDGRLALPNLSAEVRVLRDTYGIPHIYAQNKKDALRALGYTMASERLFQMEVARRLTQGELSEVFGEVALPSDKLYRSLMLKPAIERMLAAKKSQGTMDMKMWEEMLAFYEGVNHYIDTQPLPYELTILGIKPRHFEPIDAYVLTGHMAYSFGIGMKADTLMSELAAKLSPTLFQELRNYVPKAPAPAPPAVTTSHEVLKPLYDVALSSYFPAFEGSNAWLIAPKKSQSGKSIFANDPHIGFSHPSIWAEAHIHTPEFELYGHYLPSVPFALLGHSRHHAWGFTMSLTDDMDLYRETLDRPKKMALFKNEWQPYREWTETIKIRGGRDLVLPMIETAHGPLLEHLLPEDNLSLKWAFHRTENDPLQALYQMAEAKDMGSFENALKTGTAPGLNVMYADATNIAWWIFGDMAVKKNPNSDMVFDGASGNEEYERILTWEEKPHLVNPENGFIVTANSRPLGAREDMRGDWQSDDRYQTITRALNERDLWNVDDVKSLQTENFNLQTKVILEKLLDKLALTPQEAIRYAKDLDLLKNWNLHSEIHSVEASIYHQWNSENLLLLLDKWSETEKDRYLSLPYSWIFYEHVLANETSDWWKDRSQSQLITEGFKRAMSKWPQVPEWGAIHTIEYSHPLGRLKPLNKLVNLGPYAIPGAWNEINNNKHYGMLNNFQVVAGPSTRRVIDFAAPQTSFGINPIGISGHLMSPYYKDQVQLFLDGKYRGQLMDEADIKKAKTHELVLHP